MTDTDPYDLSPTPNTLLILDIGSSSVRALLFDINAPSGPQLISDAQASRPVRFVTGQDGAATLNADALLRKLELCIDDALTHPAAQGIRAVGAAAFAGSLLGMDARGKAITPLLTYADTRSYPDTQLLAAQVDAQAVHQRTGCRLHSAYAPAQLGWLLRTDAALFGQVAVWGPFATYMMQAWFGVATCSTSLAAWNGLLDRASLTWDAEWCDFFRLKPGSLPLLTDYSHAQRGLRPDYALRWPLLATVPFFLPVGDGAAANVGSGAMPSAMNERSPIALTVGTTAALRIISTGAPPPLPDGLWSYRVDNPHHMTGGATSEGGSVYQWARATLKLPDGADLEAMLATREADAHGLTFLPLLAGERAPGWRGDASGSIHGLRLATTPLDLLHAALEGVAYRLALIADLIDPDGESLVYGGGGALVASPAWAQIITNALNRPLHLLAEPEITARGVALLVLHALDGLPLHTHPPHVSTVLTPDPDAVARLAAARQRQIHLYNQLYGTATPT